MNARMKHAVAAMADGRWRRVVRSYDYSPHDSIPSAVARRLICDGMVEVDRQHSVSLYEPRTTYVRLNAAGIRAVLGFAIEVG